MDLKRIFGCFTCLKIFVLCALLALSACGSKSNDGPNPSDDGLSKEQRESLVECASSVNQLATVAPDMRQRMVVDACAKVLREKACHEEPPAQGTTRQERCRQAYCKKLNIDCKAMKADFSVVKFAKDILESELGVKVSDKVMSQFEEAMNEQAAGRQRALTKMVSDPSLSKDERLMASSVLVIGLSLSPPIVVKVKKPIQLPKRAPHGHDHHGHDHHGHGHGHHGPDHPH